MKKNFTKIFLFGISTILIGTIANAQNSTGLEKIIVEKYYISNQADADASVGTLPVGSVTYRIFVDMKQGYKFQAAFGSSAPSPLHTLFFKTTTSFFNNEDRGAISPTYTKTQAKNNTVMLDSWLSSGAACAGNIGILKSDDDGVGTVVNANGILQNADALAGIPLSVQDGFKLGTPGTFSKIEADASAFDVLDATSQMGNLFNITNGAWGCNEGAVGYDTTNKVLIAQITTDGDFSFELNLQLGTPSGGTEQFVSKNPVNNETMFPGLTYTSINTGLSKPLENHSITDIVSVFPNPTNGNFSVNVKSENANSNNQLTIYNVVGKVIVKKNLENTSGNFSDKIDLSAYPNGMYFIEVSVDGKKSTSKLIKK
jgi:hypothetical protein